MNIIIESEPESVKGVQSINFASPLAMEMFDQCVAISITHGPDVSG